MKITFLGTGAGKPTPLRNVSAVALTLNALKQTHWLIDCGEATQHQILKSTIKISRIDRIFITHLHGDHLFGLPGLLSSRAMLSIKRKMTVYGPVGIKSYLESVLDISAGYLDYPLDVVEITDEGELFSEDGFTVSVVKLNHRITCFGFIIQQHANKSRLNIPRLEEDNIERGPLWGMIEKGRVIELDDGRRIYSNKYLLAPVKGKKVAIFGDTEPVYTLAEQINGADLLIHEATYEAAFIEKALERGHSTTHQAAQLAKLGAVKRLAITHLSPRYSQIEGQRLCDECKEIFSNTLLAEDFLTIEI